MARPLADLVALYGDTLRADVSLRERKGGKPAGWKRIRDALLPAYTAQNEALALAKWYRGEAMPGQRSSGHHVEIEGDDDGLTVNVKGQALVMNLADLIETAEIDTDEWRVVRHKVNTWTTPIKGEDGEPHVVRNWQVSANLEPRLPIEVSPVVASPLPRQPAVGTEAGCTLMVPDSQHGFRWSDDRTRLIPLHDREACDLVVQVAQRLQPHTIVLLGDMLDLAEWSTKYPRPANLRDTSQPTLAELHWWIASMRTACPTARIVYIEGNHEKRLQAGLVEAASPAAGITAVGDTRPALSVPRLLALDALGVDYVGPYGEDWYLDCGARVTHGTKVRAKGGQTATAVLADAVVSTWYGHVHRIERASRTIHTQHGRKVITAASPGCLCMVDGSTPGVTTRPDWQQGVGIQWDEGGVELHDIVEGRMTWRGLTLTGDPRGEEIAEATGWRQAG